MRKQVDLPAIDAVRTSGRDACRIVGQSLRALREVAGLTQEEMAFRLGVRQGAVSKIERRGDIQISSLERYVAALGARLRIDATFPHGLPNRVQSSDRQLVLPIIDDNSAPEGRRDVVLSVKPRYTDEIMAGRKTVELRRRFPASTPSGTVAYVYSTSPVRALVCSVQISQIVKLPVSEIWRQYRRMACIGRADFDEYFRGARQGVALELENIRPLARSLALTELRERFGFQPPQSFHYAKPDFGWAVGCEYATVPH